jgi:hypothetical protein
LAPYYDEIGSRRRRLARYGLLASLLLFCFLYGFAFALLAPFLLLFFTIPLVILFGLIIWALPDVRHPPLETLKFLFFGFMVALFAWPSYLAIALPGLPWITVTRLFSTPLAITLLICLSVSKVFRSELKSILSAAPIIPIALGLFVLAQALSIVVSRQPIGSLNRFVVAQTDWTAIFFCACFLLSKPNRAGIWAGLLWGLALYLCGLGVFEVKYGHVPWAGHIPSFLKMDSGLVDAVVGGQVRIGSGAHRVAAIYMTPLTFSEFLALAAPIALHFAATPRNIWIRVAAFATIPLLLWMAIETQSRSGVLGVGLASLLYLLMWAVRRRLQQIGGLMTTAVVVAYPALFAMVLASTLFVGKIRRKVWGGGEHAASNTARSAQYGKGIPMVFTHPFGFGMGQGGGALGFYLPNGLLTIDTYYLDVALDYGFFGFFAYYTMIYSGIFYSGRYAFKASSRGSEYSLLISCCLVLVNFAVINTIFSETANHPLIFMTLGAVVALVYRVKREGIASPDAEVAAARPARQVAEPRRMVDAMTSA